MGRGEILKHGEAFTEIGLDGGFHDLAGGAGHETTHTGKLPEVIDATTSLGVGHEGDRVEVGDTCGIARCEGPSADITGIFLEFNHHLIGDLVACVRPDVEEGVIAFAFGDGTNGEIFLDTIRTLLLRIDDFLLLRRNAEIGDGKNERPARVEFLKPEFLHVVQQINSGRTTEELVCVGDHAAATLGGKSRVIERHADRENIVENQTTDSRRDDAISRCGFFGLGIAGDDMGAINANADECMHANLLAVVGGENFVEAVEREFLAGRTITCFTLVCDREIVNTKHDILRRPDDRRTGCGREDVVRRKHENVRFGLRFDRQWQVDRHLIAVEIGIEPFAHQRVNLDGIAFNQHRLKSLNTHAVKRGSAIQQNRVPFDDFLKNVPDFLITTFDHLLRGLDRVGQPVLFELADDERLIEFKSDLLGKAALVNLEFRPDDDDRTGGVIDALAEQVFAEAALLALDHIGQRLERTVRRTKHRTAASAFVEQCIDRCCCNIRFSLRMMTSGAFKSTSFFKRFLRLIMRR